MWERVQVVRSHGRGGRSGGSKGKKVEAERSNGLQDGGGDVRDVVSAVQEGGECRKL